MDEKMGIDWKDGMAEFWGSAVLTWLVIGGSVGDGWIEWGMVLAVCWAAFKGAHILPVLTAGSMFNSQDWEGGLTKIGWQVGGAVGVGLLAAITGGDGVPYPEVLEFNTDLGHWLTMLIGGGLVYMVWSNCDLDDLKGLGVAAFAVGMAVAAGMALTGGADLGTNLSSLISGGSFDFDGFAMFLANTIVAGLGAVLAVKVNESL